MEYWNLRFNLKMGPALFRRCVLETIIFRFSVSLDVWGTLKQLWRRYQCQFSCFTWFTVPPYDERHKSVQPKEHFLSIARLDIKCGEPLCGITLQESVSITSTGALSRQVQETLWSLSIGHGAMVEWCILQAAPPQKTTQYNGGVVLFDHFFGAWWHWNGICNNLSKPFLSPISSGWQFDFE